MVGRLLLRGMLVGLLAGLLSFGFLRVFGEPSVDRAIGFESQMEEKEAAAAAAAGQPAPQEEAEIVSRPVQAGLGLLTAVSVYGASLGGLFALVVAATLGRLGALGTRAHVALLAGAAFVTIHLVPMLKYPANPPSVGDPATIGPRTALFFALIALSLAALVAAVAAGRRLGTQRGAWSGALGGAALYGVLMVLVFLLLPAVDEVPEGFPATVLWQFRVASLGAQAIVWTCLGLAFGHAAERLVEGRGARRPTLAAASPR